MEKGEGFFSTKKTLKIGLKQFSNEIAGSLVDSNLSIKKQVERSELFRSKSEFLDFVENKFSECFLDKGYIEEIPVNITSQVDKTVDFVGSSISPLKKYVINEDFGKTGRFLIQNW